MPKPNLVPIWMLAGAVLEIILFFGLLSQLKAVAICVLLLMMTGVAALCIAGVLRRGNQHQSTQQSDDDVELGLLVVDALVDTCACAQQSQPVFTANISSNYSLDLAERLRRENCELHDSLDAANLEMLNLRCKLLETELALEQAEASSRERAHALTELAAQSETVVRRFDARLVELETVINGVHQLIAEEKESRIIVENVLCETQRMLVLAVAQACDLVRQNEMLEQTAEHLIVEMEQTSAVQQQTARELEEAVVQRDALQAREARIKQALTDLCTCPIALTLFSSPRIGPDCVTYSKTAIERWLESSFTSPMTREPMRPQSLYANSLACDLVDLVCRLWPDSLQNIGEADVETEEQIERMIRLLLPDLESLDQPDS